MILRALFTVALPAALLCSSVGCGSDSTTGDASNNSSNSSDNGGGTSFACTSKSATSDNTQCEYYEYGSTVSEAVVQIARDACDQNPSAKSSDTCASADLLGCCESPGASGVATYACYYKGDAFKTTDNVKAICNAGSQTYVAKP